MSDPEGFLEGLLPIRDLLVDGEKQVGLATLNFDSTEFDIAVVAGVATIGKASTKELNFSTPFRIRYDAYFEIDNVDGDLVFAPEAGAAHKEGATHTYRIFADALTGDILIAPILNAQGDVSVDAEGVVTGFDSTKEYLVAITYAAGGFITLVRQVVEADLDAPLITSVVVNGTDPDELVVTFDRRALVPTAASWSLNFLSGTPRTITGVTGGQGTDTITLSLSGACDGSEVATLVILSGNTIQSLNGIPFATSADSVDFLFGPSDTITGVTHLWRGDSRTLSGADVLTVLDQIGTAHLTSGATKPTTTTLGSLTQPAMQLTAGAYLTTGVIAAETMTSGSICIVFRIVTGADRGLVTGGNGTTFEALSYVAGGGGTLLGASNQAQTGGLSAAWTPGTTIHSVCFTWNPSGREQYLDNVLNDSDTTDATTPNITKWVVGALLDLTTLSGGTLIIGEIQIGNTHLANGAEIHAIRASRYGT